MKQIKVFKYRIYPSRKQKEILLKQFEICKDIYNTLLALSKKLQTTSKFDFDYLIKEIKITCPKYYFKVYSQVLQNVSDRLHKTFKNFFRRVKEKSKGDKIKVGFPRFKSRIKSITYPQNGFEIFSESHHLNWPIGKKRVLVLIGPDHEKTINNYVYKIEKTQVVLTA